MTMTIKTLIARTVAFGSELGAGDRTTLAKSEPLYEAYVALPEADQQALKAKFVLAYFMANTGLKEAQAEVLLAAPRPQREAEGVESAARAAGMKFDYHFVDRGPKAGPSGGGSASNFAEVIKAIPRGATKHITAMADDYFGGDLGAMINAIKALKAAADAKAKAKATA
jgi:hypothetical protein